MITDEDCISDTDEPTVPNVALVNMVVPNSAELILLSTANELVAIVDVFLLFVIPVNVVEYSVLVAIVDVFLLSVVPVTVLEYSVLVAKGVPVIVNKSAEELNSVETYEDGVQLNKLPVVYLTDDVWLVLISPINDVPDVLSVDECFVTLNTNEVATATADVPFTTLLAATLLVTPASLLNDLGVLVAPITNELDETNSDSVDLDAASLGPLAAVLDVNATLLLGTVDVTPTTDEEP
jgi:hypothetical protein